MFVLRFLSFQFSTLLWNDPDQFPESLFPVVEEELGPRGSGHLVVLLYEGFCFRNILVPLDRQGHNHLRVDAGLEAPIYIVDIGGPT